MQKIIPNIWCNGNAEEMAEFYTVAFTGVGYSASWHVGGRYPSENLPDFQRGLAGKAVTVDLEIDGFQFTLINAGDEFRPRPSISFMLNFDPSMFGGHQSGDAAARDRMDQLWEVLADAGSVLMPLDGYPFSSHYGWVEDRFGVNWQLMHTNPGGDPRPFLIPALMYDGPAQDRAAEAADFYVSVFAGVPGGAAVGNRQAYGTPSGNAGADALAFGEFRIGDQWFMACDNGSGVDFGFDCGVSLSVACADQAEIDRYWDALSAVPEAEQCGWLADRYGVSWQIVPENTAELMRRPDAYAHMMGMKKLIIADF